VNHENAIVTIGQDQFFADYKTDSLRLVHDPMRQLPFNLMDGSPLTGFYYFLYDPKSKSIFSPTEDMSKLPPEVLYVEIPNQVFIDPVQKLHQKGFQDHQISKVFKNRSAAGTNARILPRATFYCDEFFVDTRSNAFIDTLNLDNRIPFSKAHVAPNDSIFLDYDLQTRQYPDRHRPGFSEESFVTVVLPELRNLDPEGWKRVNNPGKDEVWQMASLGIQFIKLLSRNTVKRAKSPRQQGSRSRLPPGFKISPF